MVKLEVGTQGFSWEEINIGWDGTKKVEEVEEQSYHMYSAMILPVQSERSRLRRSVSRDMAAGAQLVLTVSFLLLPPEEGGRARLERYSGGSLDSSLGNAERACDLVG
jgi:hypothetical protein